MPRNQNLISTSGLDEVFEDIDRLTDYDGLREDLDLALDVMFNNMRATIPVRSGYLKSTARSGSEYDGDEWTGHVVVGEGVEYLNWVYPAGEVSELDTVYYASETLFDIAISQWQVRQGL